MRSPHNQRVPKTDVPPNSEHADGYFPISEKCRAPAYGLERQQRNWLQVVRRSVLGEHRFAFLLNFPSSFVITLLVAYPILYSLWLSFHRYNLMRPNIFRFVGLGNYVTLLTSMEFWSAFRVTLLFTGLAVGAVVALAVPIALLLNEPFPGRGLVRTLVFVPWAIPPVVNGLMWQWIYDAKVGALNGLLVSLGILHDYRGWLSKPTEALLALATAHVWNALPAAIILLLAALQAIPAELYDAGRTDGAGAGKIFWHVTLPWLAQPLLVVLILQTMLAIRVFDIIYVLTAGGPGAATTTLVWQTYLTTFDDLNFGLGNTYAYTVTLITLVLAIGYFRMLYRRGDFET